MSPVNLSVTNSEEGHQMSVVTGLWQTAAATVGCDVPQFLGLFAVRL
jgi:hypothetical protein